MSHKIRKENIHASGIVGIGRGVGREIGESGLRGLAQGSKEKTSSTSLGVHLARGSCIIGIKGCNPCFLVWDGLLQELSNRNEAATHFRREVTAGEPVDLAYFSDHRELMALVLLGVKDCITVVPEGIGNVP